MTMPLTATRKALRGLLLAAAALLLAAPPASAAFHITGFDGDVIDELGQAASQAGGHPWEVSGRLSVNEHPDSPIDDGLLGLSYMPEENVRNVRIDLPPGFAGNPGAVPKCTWEELTGRGQEALCPISSQVGVLGLNGAGLVGNRENPGWSPLFNMEPPPGRPAALGANIAGIPTALRARVRGDDYGISLDAENISQTSPFTITGMVIWGTPADASHNHLRGGKIGGEGTSDSIYTICLRTGAGSPKPVSEYLDGSCQIQPGTPRKAFITNPTACTPPGVGLETRVRVESWPGSIDNASFFSHEPAPNQATQIGPTRCDKVPFDPAIELTPTSTAPDSPTGLEVELRLPQTGLENPEGIATAHLKRAAVTLPEGMTINPAAAGGLVACADEQLGFGSTADETCPAASRIGDVEVRTPLLEEKLTGSVYIRTQESDDPSSGEMFRIAIVVENDDRGVRVKLPGQVSADSETGRLTTTFDNNPQMPFDSLKLKLKSGDRAPLATPPTCGEKTVSSELTSWSGKTVALSSGFTIDCPTPAGFAPKLVAGALNPIAGTFSPFLASIERDDREQYLSGVELDLPKGALAKLRDVPLCGSVAATAGDCPAGSRIGSATAAAGAGAPYAVGGDVYLTGPYKGAPYGLAVHVHAKAGPFDLGWVRVRQALHVDPETAAVSVVSDPLPRIVKGVPVRLRSVDVDVDRRDFTVNPTSCAEKRVDGRLTAVGGAVRDVSSRFQVGDCRALGFRPRLGMRLLGSRQMRSGGHPVLRATVTQGDGQANIKAAKVRLPGSIALDARNAYDPKLVCPYDPAQAGDCPASSVIGKASLRTPLLNRPLSGPVHLVQGIRFGPTGNRIRALPTLLVKLRGEVAINLRSQTEVDRSDRLVSTFPNVPDARSGRFDIQIDGGRKGILVVTRTRRGKIDLCRGTQTTHVEMDGHNGKRADFSARAKTACKTRKAANRRDRGKR